METLEARKAKYQKYFDQGESYEDDDDLPQAIKAYRVALKYSLHKKDTDELNHRIQRLRNTQEFVNGVPETAGRNPKIWVALGSLIVLVVATVVALMVGAF